MGDDGDRTEKLSTFLTVTGTDDVVALQFLESTNWDLDSAINTFLATGGDMPAGAGDGGDAGAGLQDLMEEEVRAPIPQKVDKLVDVPQYRAGAPVMGGVGVSGHSAHAREAFRNFEEEMRHIDGAPEAEPERFKKPKNLADIYRPPLELCFRGTFQQLRETGSQEGKWLLVNIQSPVEFASQQLNADTWRDEGVRAVIGAHFLFWQQYHDDPLGSTYVRFYLKPDDQLPHVGVIDPRTGQLCKSFKGFVTAERIMDLLMTYADADLQPMPSVGAFQPGGGADDVARAVQASLADRAPQGGGAIASAAPSDPASEHVQPAAEPSADPAVDDAFWSQHAPGDEPAPGPGVVQLLLKLPDGSRTQPRHFAESAPLGAVLSHVHSSGQLRVSSTKSWQLLQSMPRAVIQGLDTPLSSIGLRGKAMLILQEAR
mmetsp:Transcript_3915/g.11335  ORF Transcript_3915/g.11335 Transcript_3915/m.11335 type:complete len:429 (+) Transcript_3915:75-1361(+)|eukprot:CAMPEP_0206044738 /NCGR_PEP_ID=MMETSP1466-20131121/13724_1 /ASSEMBLY_ACC=CAM_ASM_001126 /TAXON_ID=44452 /ORGANISM="Pavlova gyrans, Strain CCMP608" /LENGTH=428 /DNA_ID=CAMNT_0053419641 /DNA_START=52 /DNA_END=1338 /DNA_ORIENTATION=+